MNAKEHIQAFGVLIRTRSARGQRLELELREWLQTHAQKIQLEQEARDQYEVAELKLSTHVERVHDLLSSREVMHMDAILSLRAQIDFLGEAKKAAHVRCVHAVQEEVECLQRCNEMRHRIAINAERVSTLNAHHQTLQVSQALVAEDVEEEELQEAHAAGHAGRHKEVTT